VGDRGAAFIGGEIMNELKITSMRELVVKDRVVLLRLDINSPIDPATKKITNRNRLKESLPTLEYLFENSARIAVIAHQGDTLDYQNLMPLNEHAEILSEMTGRQIKYIDDVCGPAAQGEIRNLKPGGAVLLGNLRYLSEEISTFENAVKLKPDEMLGTYLVRSLAPLVDIYINDAFSAAHRNAPSMTAFQEIKPTGAGDLLFREVEALSRVMESPVKPSVFILGGAKISDAFGMMKQVLANGTADKILTCGITGEIFLMASGFSIGGKKEKYLRDKSLLEFIEPAREYLRDYPRRIEIPSDLAYESNGRRKEINLNEISADEMFMDIGTKTILNYSAIISGANTLFANGPAGAYENPLFEKGTKDIWQAIADSDGFSVIGGGDTVAAAEKLIDIKQISYVCTAGGAMVRFLTGKKLPLIKAMEDAYERLHENK
jgi:phosphoglycerate kinase